MVGFFGFMAPEGFSKVSVGLSVGNCERKVIGQVKCHSAPIEAKDGFSWKPEKG